MQSGPYSSSTFNFPWTAGDAPVRAVLPFVTAPTPGGGPTIGQVPDGVQDAMGGRLSSNAFMVASLLGSGVGGALVGYIASGRKQGALTGSAFTLSLAALSDSVLAYREDKPVVSTLFALSGMFGLGFVVLRFAGERHGHLSGPSRRIALGRIEKITSAYVRKYADNDQTVAYVEWVDHRGKHGRTEGKPGGAHMEALMQRAKREGVPVKHETWGGLKGLGQFEPGLQPGSHRTPQADETMALRAISRADKRLSEAQGALANLLNVQFHRKYPQWYGAADRAFDHVQDARHAMHKRTRSLSGK